MITVSHPIGNENVRALINGLEKNGQLHSFITSIATFQNAPLGYASQIPGLSELKRRAFSQPLKPYTKTFMYKEVVRIVALKLGLSNLVKHEEGAFCIDEVCRYIDSKTAQYIESNALKTKAIYAYEDAALESFEAAKKKGITRIYDLPIGYWRSARRLLQNELQLWPEWAATLTGFSDSEKKLKIKDDEIASAQHIIVASTFTANTLKEYSGPLPPIHVIPYGFPTTDTFKQQYSYKGTTKLKVLFVGGLSQRKGLAYLFSVAEKYKEYIELTIVGSKITEECIALDKELKKHKWIPSLPHHEILTLMKQQDVLAFPSLFEGFGLVITEAMSQGIPVITTERTAGLDLINHGENGWLMQAGSLEAFEEMLDSILSNPAQIEFCGRAARQTALNRPWSLYGAEMAVLLDKIIP